MLNHTKHIRSLAVLAYKNRELTNSRSTERKIMSVFHPQQILPASKLELINWPRVPNKSKITEAPRAHLRRASGKNPLNAEISQLKIHHFRRGEFYI